MLGSAKSSINFLIAVLIIALIAILAFHNEEEGAVSRAVKKRYQVIFTKLDKIFYCAYIEETGAGDCMNQELTQDHLQITFRNERVTILDTESELVIKKGIDL